MKKLYSLIIFSVTFLFIYSGIVSTANAAVIKADGNVNIPSDERNLSDAYLFGNMVEVNAPVNNDLVTAGGDLSLNSNVSGNINAAGGNVKIKGATIGSVRVAGGNILIDGNIGRDLLIAGGRITVAKSASISGDLLLAGGQLVMQGTVGGRVIIRGGDASIQGKVGKQVEAITGKLTVGPSAVIGGDLSYSSSQKADISKDAKINGKVNYTQIKEPKKAAEATTAILSGITVYQLIVDIVITLLFIYFFRGVLTRISVQALDNPAVKGLYGLAFMILTPIVSLILLILFWPGVILMLLYFIVIILLMYITKIFLGWFILRWWYRRDKVVYDLDWKAAAIGVLVAFVINLIPVIGWLIMGIIYLITLGAVIDFKVRDMQQREILLRKDKRLKG